VAQKSVTIFRTVSHAANGQENPTVSGFLFALQWTAIGRERLFSQR